MHALHVQPAKVHTRSGFRAAADAADGGLLETPGRARAARSQDHRSAAGEAAFVAGYEPREVRCRSLMRVDIRRGSKPRSMRPGGHQRASEQRSGDHQDNRQRDLCRPPGHHARRVRRPAPWPSSLPHVADDRSGREARSAGPRPVSTAARAVATTCEEAPPARSTDRLHAPGRTAAVSAGRHGAACPRSRASAAPTPTAPPSAARDQRSLRGAAARYDRGVAPEGQAHRNLAAAPQRTAPAPSRRHS